MPDTRPRTGRKPGRHKDTPNWKTLITKELVEECIPGTGGLASIVGVKVAKKLGRELPYSTFLEYWHTLDIENAVKAEKEKIKDIGEKNIFTAMNDGDIQTSKWYLAQMAKERGYGLENQTNIQVINKQEQKDVSKMLENLTEEERELYFSLCEKLNGSVDE